MSSELQLDVFPPQSVEVPSGERLRGEGRHGVSYRLNCVIHAWMLKSGLSTMQGAIQALPLLIIFTMQTRRIALYVAKESQYSYLNPITDDLL